MQLPFIGAQTTHLLCFCFIQSPRFCVYIMLYIETTSCTQTYVTLHSLGRAPLLTDLIGQLSRQGVNSTTHSVLWQSKLSLCIL